MVAELCKKHGKAWGLPCGNYDAVKTYADMGAQLLSMGGEFVSVMNTFQEGNSVFDRVLDETYGPFASPDDPAEAAAILAEARLAGNLLAANDVRGPHPLAMTAPLPPSRPLLTVGVLPRSPVTGCLCAGVQAPRVASTEQAYAVQDAMITASDELGLGAVYGWKTGTAPLFECGRWADGATISYPGLKVSAMEGEVGLIFAKDLPPRSAAYTEDEIFDAVGSGAMVIEVCRSSYDKAWGPTPHQVTPRPSTPPEASSLTSP